MTFGPDQNTSPGSMPPPGADGALPVSNDGVWEVGTNKDAKAKSLQAQEGVSGASVQAGALITTDGDGNTTQIEPDGTVTVNAQEIYLPSLSGGSVDPRTNGGYMTVPYFRPVISGDAVQVVSWDGGETVGVEWIQQVAHEFGPFSPNLSVITTPGTLTWGLMDNTVVGSEVLMAMGEAATGSQTGRLRITPVVGDLIGASSYQLYPGRKYLLWIGADGEETVEETSFSIPYGRQGTDQRSGLVPNVTCYANTGEGNEALLQDDQPAQLQIVLNSSGDGASSPMLVYGWDGKHGNKVALYINSAWALYTIPDSGLWYDYSQNMSGTHKMFLTAFGGVLELGSYSSDFIYQDGIKLKKPNSETDKHRYVGMVQAIALT